MKTNKNQHKRQLDRVQAENSKVDTQQRADHGLKNEICGYVVKIEYYETDLNLLRENLKSIAEIIARHKYMPGH